MTCSALAGHGRHQGDRGRAAAHDDHLPTGVVEVLGPLLGVDDGAGEVVEAGDLGGEPALVVVVARAAPQHVAGHRGRGRLPAGDVGALDGDRPAGGARVPVGGRHPPGVADQPVDVVLRGDGAQVVEDRGAVGQRPVAAPRAPREAEGEHVGVRADAGVAEQVPGAAGALPRLQHGHRAGGVLDREPAGGADAGEAGTDDQDVDVLGGVLGGLLGGLLGGGAHGVLRGAVRGRAKSSTKRASTRGGSVTVAVRAAALTASAVSGAK